MGQNDTQLEGQSGRVHHPENNTRCAGNQDKRDQNFTAAEKEIFPMFLAWQTPVSDHHKDDQTRGRIKCSDAGRVTEPEQKIHKDRDR